MGKTILVVDDAGVMRQMNALTLKKEGFEVIEAVDGKDALLKMDGKQIDLVVTDINMPEMDGIELIRHLRGSSEHRFIPIIVLSTISQEAKVQEGKEAGASGWIFKPYKPHELMGAIRKFIT
ncbi:MAG: two-component system response regulator [Thermodesulfovibrio sp.]|nr:two-component system response regulator [Thermodesulfovibrio sp.]